jgi:type II restriction enzyme
MDLKTLILEEISDALDKPHKCHINPESDLMTKEFVDMFVARLKLHHAIHAPTKKVNKYDFEYIFNECANFASFPSKLNDEKTPIDIYVACRGDQERPFQLKTETAKNMKEDKIYISKLREARFIRQCKTKKDLLKHIQEVLIPHIQQFESIFLLRGRTENNFVRYDLLELPIIYLEQIKDVSMRKIKISHGKNKSYSIPVKMGKKHILTYYFCGGVEKISLKDLSVDTCIHHATWWI